MTLREKQSLFAIYTAHLIQKIYESGYTITYGEAWRSAEQAAIYASKGIGIKDSLHCKRLAIDINLFKDGKLLQNKSDFVLFGNYWKSLNKLNRWGGDFPRVDCVHFEMQDI